MDPSRPRPGKLTNDDRRTRIDALILIPFTFFEELLLDRSSRTEAGASLYGPLLRAYGELEAYVGAPLTFGDPSSTITLNGKTLAPPRHRATTPIVLAQCLEQAGLSWAAVDPGDQSLAYWRNKLKEYEGRQPAVVAISTTFCNPGSRWLQTLCRLVRQLLPASMIVIGGPAFATSARDFLRLDADVYFLGEAELRLPQVVKCLRELGASALFPGSPLHSIPGLYLRRQDHTLQFTGAATPLCLDDLPCMDWALMQRIDPPCTPGRDGYRYLETQRGCLLNCRFCTYRTLMPFSAMSPDCAATHVLNAANLGGLVCLTDATATFPRDRWKELMARLIERGGSRAPLLSYARVTDLESDAVQLMAKAGFRWVLVGQESGDQRVLDLMKKGIRVSDVVPAVRNLADASLASIFFFIHGFPGEDEEMAQNTKRLILSLNDQCPDRLPVVFYQSYYFVWEDFAAVSADRKLPEGSERGANRPLDRSRVCRLILDTFIESSRIPHAPVPFDMPAAFAVVASQGDKLDLSTRVEAHRWLKSLHRGTAIYLECELSGKKPDAAELKRLKEDILKPLGRRAGVLGKHRLGAVARMTKYLTKEWLDESRRGKIGRLTKTILVVKHYQLMGDIRQAAEIARSGEWPDYSRDSPDIEQKARELIDSEVGRSRSQRKRSSSGQPGDGLQPDQGAK